MKVISYFCLTFYMGWKVYVETQWDYGSAKYLCTFSSILTDSLSLSPRLLPTLHYKHSVFLKSKKPLMGSSKNDPKNNWNLLNGKNTQYVAHDMSVMHVTHGMYVASVMHTMHVMHGMYVAPVMHTVQCMHVVHGMYASRASSIYN